MTNLLNPTLNCFVTFTLSLIDKVTIGTCNLASVISNSVESPSLDSLQSTLIQDELFSLLMAFLMISKNYFNEKTVFASFAELFSLLWFVVSPTTSAFYLKDSEISIVKLAFLSVTSSLLNCHKLPDVSG